MDIKFSKAILMSGEDYQLTNYITLHHPTVKEVLSINNTIVPDSTYWLYTNILLADPYTNMVMLDDIGKNYLEVSPYEVFIIQWEECLKEYQKNQAMYDTYQINPLDDILKALCFFLDGEYTFVKGKYEDGSVCFYDKYDSSRQINQQIFEYIYEWVKSINKIDYSNRINPVDENARRVLIEDKRDEIKKAKRKKKKSSDNNDYFGNIMSANCFGGNGSITPFNINDCKIYWLNESLGIINKKNYADHLLDGIYHGTISSKDVNNEALDWVNK